MLRRINVKQAKAGSHELFMLVKIVIITMP